MKLLNREQGAKFLNCCVSAFDSYRKKGLPWNDTLNCTTQEALERWVEHGIRDGEDIEDSKPDGTYHKYDDGTFQWIDDDGYVTCEGRWKEKGEENVTQYDRYHQVQNEGRQDGLSSEVQFSG